MRTLGSVLIDTLTRDLKQLHSELLAIQLQLRRVRGSGTQDILPQANLASLDRCLRYLHSQLNARHQLAKILMKDAGSSAEELRRVLLDALALIQNLIDDSEFGCDSLAGQIGEIYKRRKDLVSLVQQLDQPTLSMVAPPRPSAIDPTASIILSLAIIVDLGGLLLKRYFRKKVGYHARDEGAD